MSFTPKKRMRLYLFLVRGFRLPSGCCRAVCGRGGSLAVPELVEVVCPRLENFALFFEVVVVVIGKSYLSPEWFFAARPHR